MRIVIYCCLGLLVILGCTKAGAIQPDVAIYFPSGNAWESKPMASLNWNTNAVQPLKDFLSQTNTKSFMILVDGHTATIAWDESLNKFTTSFESIH